MKEKMIKINMTKSTSGELTKNEKMLICKKVMEGEVCGHLYTGENYGISFNLITTRTNLSNI